LLTRRPAAAGNAALAITDGLLTRRPAAAGNAALAITDGLPNAANRASGAHSRRPATRGNAALAIADATHQLQWIEVTVVDPYHFCLCNVRARSWPASGAQGPRIGNVFDSQLVRA
jgi:hypothetical protein